MEWAIFLPILVFLGLFVLESRLMGQHLCLSDAPRAIATFTCNGNMVVVDDTGLRTPFATLRTKFEVRMPFRLEDMMHFWSQH